MNQVSYNDFGLFETEKLSVDYICMNLSQAALYFQALNINKKKNGSEVTLC